MKARECRSSGSGACLANPRFMIVACNTGQNILSLSASQYQRLGELFDPDGESETLTPFGKCNRHAHGITGYRGEPLIEIFYSRAEILAAIRHVLRCLSEHGSRESTIPELSADLFMAAFETVFASDPKERFVPVLGA